MTRARIALALVGALIGTATPAAAGEASWVSLDPRIRPPGASASMMAYDEARGEMVLFGGAGQTADPTGTWIRRDGEWSRAQVEVEPPQRYAGSMTYDARREEIVLFGGYVGTGQGNVHDGETWIWDGEGWERREPEASPSPRAYAAIAYDRVREETVLFGGIGPGFERTNDTWVWDGQTWQERESPVAPDERLGGGMVFDEARGETVLFGGSAQSVGAPCTLELLNICIRANEESGDPGHRGDTWVWDGQTWTERPVTDAPAPRSAMGMAFDPERDEVVLFAGVSDILFADTWTWDGLAWTRRSPSESPEGRFSPAMAADRDGGEVVAFGGHRISYLGADTWGWDGDTWRSLEISTPKPRFSAAFAFDAERDEAVLFGGIADEVFGDTWTRDEHGWQRRSPATSPPARYHASAAYDPRHEQVVLFGGLSDRFQELNDTWVWEGETWREISPALPSLSPIARHSAATAYDALRGELVIFGGRNFDLGMVLADTWAWDGTRWEPRLGLTSPPALYDANMAFDAARGEVVLFGGLTGANQYSEQTWVWDGQVWSQRQPQASPPARFGAGMTYDPATERVVLFGGNGPSAPDVWTWNGTEWTQIDPGPGPPRRTWGAVAAVPGGTLLFGGQGGGYRDDTWLLRPE